MSRAKSFDEDAVLDRAARLFWARGFEGTSISDLEEDLGLGRQSLYDTYGDKRALFLKALDRYGQWNRSGPLEPLLAPDASLPALRRYFDGLVEFLAAGEARRACLMTNSILEFDRDDTAVMAKCSANQEAVLGALEIAVERARQCGEISEELEVAEVSRMLMSQVYGLAVLSKTGMPKGDLRALARQLLDCLR